VLAFATGYVATALPLPGGGSGGIEAALAFSLHAGGRALAPALLAALVYRFFTFWLPLLPALALLPSDQAAQQELPRFARSVPAQMRFFFIYKARTSVCPAEKPPPPEA
jgi:hypothetical protein